MLSNHVVYSLRLLRRSPIFAITAIATFALAIGTTTAVFSHVMATILAPLPFPNGEQLVSVWPSGGSLARSSMAAHMYDAVAELSDTFAGVTAMSGQSRNLTGAGDPERVEVSQVTQSFAAVLGTTMAAGRWFTADEDRPGHNAVVVLSQGFLLRRFGGDTAIVGRTITLDAVPHVVVGIMAGAPYPERTDVWVPIAFTAGQRSMANRGLEYLTVIARLRPGVTLPSARGQLDALGQRLRTVYGIPVKWTLGTATLDDDLRGQLRPIVLTIFGAVALVFVVACANLANLMLARAGDRHREYAVRMAVGAAPSQIRVQSLVEASTLAALGGSAGVLLAVWLAPLLGRLAATAGVRLPQPAVDAPVLLFSLAVTIASAILAGALPSWQIARVALVEALGRAGRASSGSRSRPALVVAELALAFVVVVSAALLTKSLGRLMATDPGFDVDSRLTARLSLPVARYATRPQRDAFYARLFQELQAVPGVAAAGGVSELPLSNQGNMASFDVEHRAVTPGENEPHADMRSATAGYFPAMGITLRRGRLFDARDAATTTQVALVDDTVAGRVFGGEDPIGRRVALGIDPDGWWREIVGVVSSVHHESLDTTIRGAVYVPLTQRPTRSIFMVLRIDRDPALVVSQLRSVVSRLDPDLPVFDVATLRSRLDESFGRREIAALVVTAFAAIAFILAGTGVYGVIAYAVGQRTREIGVRMALGAERRQVLWLFVRGTCMTTLAGIAIGSILAVPLMRSAAVLLFNVEPFDPAVYGVVAASFVVITAAISAVSARRAATIDPITVLK